MPVSVPDFTIVAASHERVHRDPAQAWLRQTIATLTAAWVQAKLPAAEAVRPRKAA